MIGLGLSLATADDGNSNPLWAVGAMHDNERQNPCGTPWRGYPAGENAQASIWTTAVHREEKAMLLDPTGHAIGIDARRAETP